jgi:hypothetical protein
MASPLEVGLNLMIEQTITVGNIIEIAVIAVGGVSVFITLRNTVANIKADVDSLQVEIKKLGEILVNLARFDERITSLDKRVTAQGRRIDDLSHGDGFVRPRPGIDGEYP